MVTCTSFNYIDRLVGTEVFFFCYLFEQYWSSASEAFSIHTNMFSIHRKRKTVELICVVNKLLESVYLSGH